MRVVWMMAGSSDARSRARRIFCERHRVLIFQRITIHAVRLKVGVQSGIRQELDELHSCSSTATPVDEHGHVDIQTKFRRKDRDWRDAGSGDDP